MKKSLPPAVAAAAQTAQAVYNELILDFKYVGLPTMMLLK